MAQQDFYISTGDSDPELQVTLKDADDAVVDVTGATITFSMRRKGRRETPIVDREAVTLVTPSSGIVKYSWPTDGTDTPAQGDYDAEFRVTYSGGRIETFPNSKKNKMIVHVQEGM